MVEWYIESGAAGQAFTRMQDWEEAEINHAVSQGQNVLVYNWPKKWPEYPGDSWQYELDLALMIQKNMDTGTVRRLLMLGGNNHVLLSPFNMGAKMCC